MTSPDLAQWLILIAATLTAAATIWRLVIRPFRRFSAQVRDFMGGWFGWPAIPGRPRTEGVLEKLDILADDLAEVDSKLVEHLDESERLGREIRDTITENRALIDEHITAADAIRLAGHHESEKLWEAIGRIADGDPPDDLEGGESS